VGSLPIYPAFSQHDQEEQKENAEQSGPREITKTVILPDGSYGTQTIIVDDSKKTSKD